MVSRTPPYAALRRPRDLLGPLGLLTACYDPSSVVGLPCSDDEACGPEHVCALGFCRADLDDALADCGDGVLDRGEFCYPLTRRQSLPFGEPTLHAAAWADVDGDGRTDVLTASDQGTVVHVNLGGTFTPNLLAVELTPQSLAPLELPEPLTDVSLPVRPVRATLGDFIGDPLPDAVFSVELAGEVPEPLLPVQEAIESLLWLADNQSVTASPPQMIAGTDPLGRAEVPFDGMRTGDFDGDGRDDVLIVTIEDEGAVVRWLRGSAEGPLPPQRLSIEGSSSIEVADIDEDGRDDILVLHRAAGVVSLLRGPFDRGSVDLDLGGSTVAMHVGALDEVPGLELVTLGFDPPLRRLLSWTGSEFDAVTSRSGPEAVDITAGDVDGDGWPELITAGLDGIAVHSGFSGTEFGSSFTIVDEPAGRVDLRSLDDDAAPDLVLTGDNRLVTRFALP